MQNSYSIKVKEKLTSIIEEMEECHWLFTKNPSRDFSRHKKWSFSETMQFILNLQGRSLKDELLYYFDFQNETPSSSSFDQRRNQILPEAFQFLFYEFTKSFCKSFKTYKGYQLIACDGTDMNIPHNPNDETTYIHSSSKSRGYNQFHINAFYDLCNRTYIDAVIQPAHQEKEVDAMCEMIDRYSGKKTIFIADRNYECYNIFAHIREKGMYFLIRAKDIKSTGILQSLDLPDDPEFDIFQSTLLTIKRSKEIKDHPEKYKYIGRCSKFDYLDAYVHMFYPINFRILRFHIGKNNYECIITNLPKDEFSTEEIKELYAKRWGIETSFRELKYAVGLVRYHSKKNDYLIQEIWARLIIYNFCEIITMSVVIQKDKNLKYTYQLNYTRAISICRYFLSVKEGKAPPDVEYLIGHELLPVRPGKSNPRKVRTDRSPMSFLYRVA